MPPKKWEDEESEEETSSDESSVDVKPVVPAARRKFDDEEDSDDVADNWDEEEDSEVEREKAAKVAAAKAQADAEAAANKKSKSQRIEEHREANRRRRAAEDNEATSDEEDEGDKRARLRASEKDSDLKHAEDLFGDLTMGNRKGTNKAVVIEDKNGIGQTVDLSQLSLFKPSTKGQFEELGNVLGPLLAARSNHPNYPLWVARFVKQICAELPSTEIKKAASGLTALGNEKMKEEKAQDKGSKKTKAAKTKATLSAGRDVSRGVADTTAYDDDGMGDDDFM